jgi:serine acetyltransferase/GT2 family glycosyltransferase
VVVVDDGSAEPVAPLLARRSTPFGLRVETQANAGAAAARHRGVLAATGEVLVIVDDDMQVAPDFLARHLALHAKERRVVIGRIAGDPGVAEMPLFERWHQRLLDELAVRAGSGAEALRGNLLYTGNVSMRREDYLAVGGFDTSLGHSEDAELGLRLEEAGLPFVFSAEAYTLHGSDHTELAKWRRRARAYGRFDKQISRKHPALAHANPWRFLFELHPLARPFLAGAVLAPRLSGLASRAAYGVASAADRLGFKRGAMRGATLSYGIEYFGGLREENGSLARTLLDLGAFLLQSPVMGNLAGRRRAWTELKEEIASDFETINRYQAKYDERAAPAGGPASALVTRIGFQLIAAYRLMRAFVRAEMLGAAKVTSRLIRHAYGAEIHWEAELAPGVMIVHGTGLTISRAARVGRDCILFHNVTLGIGTDPVSRRSGAPTVEDEVHIGPGATLIGPITVGRGSKIMAGVVLTESVPAGSLVEAPAARVAPRISRPPVQRHG